MLREGAARHAKVTLIDWHQVTDGREDEQFQDFLLFMEEYQPEKGKFSVI